MAKLGSWGNAVKGKTQNRRRSRKSSGGGFIGDYKTEVGVKHRIVIPTFVDEDGNEGLFIQSRVVHPVKKRGAVSITTKNGKSFTPYAIGTSHPYKQPSFDASVVIAERGDVDVFSQFAALTETDRWAKVNQLGNDKNTEEGKKEFVDFNKDFTNQNTYIEACTYKNRDGEYVDSIENYILILQLATEMVEEERGSGVKRKVARVALGENGLPKYEPKFWRVSAKRLGDIKSAIDLALDNELIGDEQLHPYTEAQGTDDETTVYTGWVELELNYPFKEGNQAKMEAGREMTISAVNGNNTNVTAELIADFRENKNTELFEKAVKDFEFSKSHLKAHTRAEQLEMLSDDARDYFNYLLETYSDEAKQYEERFKGYFANILAQAGKTVDNAGSGETAQEESTTEPEAVAEESVEETPKEEAKPKTRAKKTAKKAEGKGNKDKLNELLKGI